MKRLPVLDPEVKNRLERWRPTTWNDEDVRTLEPLLPELRSWVEKANPSGIQQAVRLLRAAAGIAKWAVGALGTTDPTVVLHPNNVEHWTMTVNAHQPRGWRENKRGTLRALGRANNPAAWPPPTRKIGKQEIAQPYTPREEAVFRLVAKLRGRHDRSRRLWIVAAALGAGLLGTEIATTRTGDLKSITGGRLTVRVRGRNPRLVPIRNDYTNLARAAADTAPTDRFIPNEGRNAVHWVTGRLDPGNGQGLSLRRARSTWLVAHLLAGTPLPVFRKIAGPLAANTLDVLLGYAVTAIDDETAVMGALGA